MAWTTKQKATAIMACKAAGLPDAHRKLILRQLPNAFYNMAGQATEEPTSTSARLTNADLELFMAVVEHQARGQVKLKHRSYSAGYWAGKAQDRTQRARNLAGRLAAALEGAGLLAANGEGLAGWIIKYVRHDGATLDQLDMVELHKLINGLRSFAKRRGVAIDTEVKHGSRESATG